jgi:hypothetical protein
MQYVSRESDHTIGTKVSWRKIQWRNEPGPIGGRKGPGLNARRHPERNELNSSRHQLDRDAQSEPTTKSRSYLNFDFDHNELLFVLLVFPAYDVCRLG